MDLTFNILPVGELPDGIEALRAKAAAEGFDFLDRLIRDWRSGANRFAQPGEIFLAGFQDGGLIAVGGLNIDPYTDEDGIGRLRHIYVRRSFRRFGIGSVLVRALLRHADGVFRSVRLKTETREAAAFYIRLGFHAVQHESATHVWTPGRQAPF